VSGIPQRTSINPIGSPSKANDSFSNISTMDHCVAEFCPAMIETL